MQDPVFTGNKFEYLKLMKDLVTRTLKIPMDYFLKNPDVLLAALRDEVSAFRHYSDEFRESLWVKLPYGQHGSVYSGKRFKCLSDEDMQTMGIEYLV